MIVRVGAGGESVRCTYCTRGELCGGWGPPENCRPAKAAAHNLIHNGQRKLDTLGYGDAVETTRSKPNWQQYSNCGDADEAARSAIILAKGTEDMGPR